MLRYLLLGVTTVLATDAHAVDGKSVNFAVPAATFAEDTGDVLRIESAEYLRTYSQEIAAAACFLYNDIDATLSASLLEESRKGFDKHYDALMNGSAELGIVGGEKRKKTIVKLEKIGAVWSDMRTSVDALLVNERDSQAVQVIKTKNVELFDMTDILVTEIEAQYANPAELMASDLLLLEIVGRQAMMTQKIAKNACKIFTGNQSEDIKKSLSKSIAIYDASLDALLNGMPQLGIVPAPNDKIANALIKVKADWDGSRGILDTLLAGNDVDRDTQIYLFKHMVQEMVRLEEISHMYVEHSKHTY